MFKVALYVDTIAMALGTLWANKLRSFLTVLGIVIGITAIVGMTSLVRGFDEAVKDEIRQLGPKTVYVVKLSGMFMGHKEFLDKLKRPNLTVADAKAIERESTTLEVVDVWLGEGGPGGRSDRAYYHKQKTVGLRIVGTTERAPEASALGLAEGRYFTQAEVQHHRPMIVLGSGPAAALFPGVDPVGKRIRLGAFPFTVVGTLKKPTSSFDSDQQDNRVMIPETVYDKLYGLRGFRIGKSSWSPVLIVCVPRDDVERDEAMADIERIMRIRHGLKADQENDFELLTQDSAMKMYEDITKYVFLGLVVLSSIALMVGGIGVMTIMTISVTERTREIGVRKALGARRREILWQFLLEAGTLTSVGGVLGIGLGASIGLLVHWLASFPVSMPVWSFAIGFGFSAGVGIFFGMWPAYRASRLDPIEALRYE